jgi:predicted DsbA family dithiol-disulfide isomerase
MTAVIVHVTNLTPGSDDPTDGTRETAVRMQNSMNDLASRNDVEFNFTVKTHWQPIESQRMQLWASRFGKAEHFMDELGGAVLG